MLDHNQKSKDNHLASVSDILRYRLVHDFGGFYFDMKFELLNAGLLARLAFKHKVFLITANEFPFAPEERFYLSNGFFAAARHHPVLANMLYHLHAKKQTISRTGVDVFGPAYFLRFIWGYPHASVSGWLMLEHDKIYPYIDWTPRSLIDGRLLRKAHFDPCIKATKSLPYHLVYFYHFFSTFEHLKLNDSNSIYYKYPCKVSPNTIAIDHFDYGSSWNSHNRLNGNHRE